MKNSKTFIELEKNLYQYSGKDRIISSWEAKKHFDDNPLKATKFYSSFERLNDLTDGFALGELIVIGGITGEGKTSISKSLTRDYALRGVKCLWFSFEIPLRHFISQYKTVPKFYAPAEITKINLTWLEERIIEGLCKADCRIVFIDHLHFLLPMTADSDKLIGGVMRKLKLMALKYNICIFLMCHVTKDAFDRPLRLSDLRGSSMISQEADYVLLIWRKKNPDTHSKFEYMDTGIVKVAKNRRTGRLGSFGVQMKEGLFVEEGL